MGYNIAGKQIKHGGGDMQHVILHNRAVIEPVLRRAPHLHIYELGDMDDAFWPLTQWHGLKEGRILRAVSMLYSGFSVPTLLALGDIKYLSRLVKTMRHSLPEKIYCHLAPGLSGVLEDAYVMEPKGRHYKMALLNRALVVTADTDGAVPLSVNEAVAIKSFYDEAFPENWFQPHLLKTNKYFGIYESGRLACAAGVHIFSSKYRVAAVGNVTTSPLSRGKGLATAATAAVCKSLLPHTDLIGLNVRQDNAPAIACYRKLGFEVVGEYEEYLATAR